MNYLVCDKTRYTGKMPRFQYYYRKCQQSTGMLLLVYRALFSICKRKKHIDLYYRNLLGGLYRENPVKSRNYEAVKSSKKWENVGNSYIIPALLLYRYSYI